VFYINRYQQGYYRTTYSRPQSFQEGYRVSRDRVPMNMRPASVNISRPNNNDRRPSTRPDWNDRNRPYTRPEISNRPGRPNRDEQPSVRPTPETRPVGPDRQRPVIRPSQPNQPNGPVARPNPPQRPSPEARPGNNGRGNRNGTGTTRNND